MRTQNQPLGKVVSNLARACCGRIVRDGFPVFAVAADAEPITDEMVAAALEDAP